jgi:hypothetical protein
MIYKLAEATIKQVRILHAGVNELSKILLNNSTAEFSSRQAFNLSRELVSNIQQGATVDQVVDIFNNWM